MTGGLDLAAIVGQWPVGAAVVGVVGRHGVLAVHDDGRPYPWKSVTKLLTAVTTIDAALDGYLRLDDPAGPPGATVRHLLAHASGLGPERADRVMAPGRRRIYSNVGYEELAAIVAAATRSEFTRQLTDRVLDPLGMPATTLVGSAAHGVVGPLAELLALATELLTPAVLDPALIEMATAIAFPGLDGVLPGFGRQAPNDWGLGFEIRDGKSPHWTSPDNSPATFGHFGQSGSFLWVDREAGLACASLCDTPFGPWAARAWPDLSSRVLAAFRS